VGAIDAAFELRVTRPSYDEPVEVNQTVFARNGQTEKRSLPADTLDGWGGLGDFISIEIKDAQGLSRPIRTRTFCPNGYERQRISDDGPAVPVYPSGCFANPFTRGMVWGIDQNWAVDPFGYGGAKLRVPEGEYEVTISITERYRFLLGIPDEDASATFDVTVEKLKQECGREGCYIDGHGRTAAGDPEAQNRGVPTMEDPDDSLLPDLRALPSFGISVDNRRRKAKSYLTFGANVWAAGSASLVVEGFRRSGEDVMDAYQYFYRDGEPVGRAPVGGFEFDERPGHSHWHFLQFAAYRLVDADGMEIVRSKKEAFCLVPTDPIDLELPGADWNPGSVGLFTNCGYPNSIWIRETLPLGWGDTYHQGRPGQSFNITDLPNGTYYIEVEANPGGGLHEQDFTNNSELREVIIKGKPGARTVTVPPWHGIDSEAGYFGEGPAPH
jgi:hypothetical protein